MFSISNLIKAIEASNNLTLSCCIAKIRDNHHGKKSLLATSNDSCWLATSGPKILKVKLRNKVTWHCRLRKRVKINSIEGKDAKSTVHATKIKAEMLLHRFRFNTENKVGKESTLKRLNELIENNVSPLAAEVSIENNSNRSSLGIALSPYWKDESESSSKSTIL